MAGKTDYKRQWNEENLDRLYVTVPKGDKEKIVKRAKEKGHDSYNSYINALIEHDRAEEK